MPSSAEPATAFHKVQESISAVSKSKTTASYFIRCRRMSRRLRLASHAVVEVEHAFAPGVDRIVGLEQREQTDGARPQERTGQRVVRVGRMIAGEEGLVPEHAARRLQNGAQGRQALFACLGLEAGEVGRAQPLATRLLEVGLIDRSDAIVEIANDQPEKRRM